IFYPPAREHGADHDVFERCRVSNLELDAVDVAALDRLEPFVAPHHERTRRPRADQHEVGMHEGAQALHVTLAQRIAPLILERLDHVAALIGHAANLREYHARAGCRAGGRPNSRPRGAPTRLT